MALTKNKHLEQHKTRRTTRRNSHSQQTSFVFLEVFIFLTCPHFLQHLFFEQLSIYNTISSIYIRFFLMISPRYVALPPWYSLILTDCHSFVKKYCFIC